VESEVVDLKEKEKIQQNNVQVIVMEKELVITEFVNVAMDILVMLVKLHQNQYVKQIVLVMENV
jgi:hypothetical protein